MSRERPEIGETSPTTFNRVGASLIATIPDNPDPETLRLFQRDALDKLESNQCNRLIIDCSGVELIDSGDFICLKKTGAMAGLMGVATVFAGLKPGIVVMLMDQGIDQSGIVAVADLEVALKV